MVITTPVFILLNGLPVLAFLGMVVLRIRREKVTGDIGYARSRAASKAARKRLAKAKSMACIETVGEFYAEIYTALISYVADKLNISPHGLTSDKVSQLLSEKGAGEELIGQFVSLMQKCDFARYAPSALTQEDIDNTLQQAETVMVSLEGVRFGR
ncbi:MAG: hypothetical protein E4H15_08995 [Syntrophobacterales bacterium]|nr:MAG: hypothetical protein E4H15_08995 [Syntrophobacterales bacterium]